MDITGKGFRSLKVWQKGKELAIAIYNMTGKGKFTKDYGLRDQLRRAAVSIPSNIAEGDELNTDKQAIRYFYMAKGSSAEVLTQAMIALEIGYFDDDTYREIESRCIEISKMLAILIAARSKES
ncbi:MAG TPA: four helix bundle protein [Deltaproteobacteria bacterium]|nr:four helix bundle protein [Deltaproteobacteria bacterium]